MNRQRYDHILGYLSGGTLEWTIADMPSEEIVLVSPTNLSVQIAQSADLILVDVRSEVEFAEGVLPGAINMPANGFASNVELIPKSNSVVLYCAAGTRSIAAISALQRFWHQAVSMSNGGTLAWSQNGLPLF